MSHRINFGQHRSARESRRRRVRSWSAWYALVALTFASLGILPSIAIELAAEHHAARVPADHHGTGNVAAAHRHSAVPSGIGAAHHAHGDFSDIPGSPTHPIDHDCDHCQVLTHLSRCIFVAQPPPSVDPAQGCPVRPNVAVVARAARDVAALPPVRGPPRHSA
jgi:hypothetical protein